MGELPKDRMTLRARIEQSRTTVEMLKRDGHECRDAERHLNELLQELRLAETPTRRKPDGDKTSA